MLTYMLDTNTCIEVLKNYPLDLREIFNALAQQLCISSITLGELHYGSEKSARRIDNLTAIEHSWHVSMCCPSWPKRLRITASFGQSRSGPHDMQIGGHARTEGLIVVTNNMREFSRMPELRAENWV